MSTSPQTANPRPRASLIRRLLAICYDLFLLLALLFIFTAVANFSLNHGEALGQDSPYYWFFVATLALISFFYYGWFWTHGGQTLGMKTWRLKLIVKDGSSLSWTRALLYFLAALLSWAVLGLGFIWSLFAHNKATWHDLIAGCEMLDLR